MRMLNKQDVIDRAKTIEELSGESLLYFLVYNGEIVYVGSTKDGELRLVAHLRNKTKCATRDKFDSVFTMQCQANERLALESRYILAMQPRYNLLLADNSEYAPINEICRELKLKPHDLRMLVSRHKILIRKLHQREYLRRRDVIDASKRDPSFQELRSQHIKGRPRRDLSGLTFGELTAIEFSHMQGCDSIWKCRCTCGKIVERGLAYLTCRIHPTCTSGPHTPGP